MTEESLALMEKEVRQMRQSRTVAKEVEEKIHYIHFKDIMCIDRLGVLWTLRTL